VNKDELAANLEEVFHETFDDPAIEISREMTASDVEEWDSFNHVRLIVAIEERFRVNFSTSEIADLKNVGDLMDLIMAHCTDSPTGRR
jgi:acyl carrier protein